MARIAAVLAVLAGIAALIASTICAPAADLPPRAAPTTRIEVYPLPPPGWEDFDARATTDAYLATLPPASTARTNALSPGGYGATMLAVVLTLALAAGILFDGYGAKLRHGLARTIPRPWQAPAQGAITLAIMAAAWGPWGLGIGFVHGSLGKVESLSDFGLLLLAAMALCGLSYALTSYALTQWPPARRWLRGGGALAGSIAIAVFCVEKGGRSISTMPPDAMIGLCVYAFALLWLTERAFRILTGWFGTVWDVRAISDPAGLPLILAALTLFGFVLQPIPNTILRRADMADARRTLISTRAPDRFAKAALAKPDTRAPAPSTLEEFWFYDRPSTRTQVLLAMRWKKTHLFDADIIQGPMSPQTKR